MLGVVAEPGVARLLAHCVSLLHLFTHSLSLRRTHIDTKASINSHFFLSHMLSFSLIIVRTGSHTHTHAHARTHAHKHTRMHTHTYTYKHTIMHIQAHTLWQPGSRTTPLEAWVVEAVVYHRLQPDGASEHNGTRANQ